MLLPSLLLVPTIGGLLCWQTDRFGNLPRWIALASMVFVLGACCWLWLTGDYSLTQELHDSPRWQEEFKVLWIPSLGISFHLGLDGMSLALVTLTGFLGVLSVACSWTEVSRHTGFFHMNLLWILCGVIGAFIALDLFLFFMFWEIMLVPMYFLVALWGHSDAGTHSRISAANKFFIYTQASGLLMLVSILGLVFTHRHATGVLTFNYETLLNTPMAPGLEYVLMLGFFIAFAVKLPVVPLHGWLPDAHSKAPTAGSVDLAGLLLKTAAYGLLRFALPLFPNASAEFAPIATWLGIVGIVYGAVLAFAQTDIKRLVAYSSISHMGFVLIGIYAGTTMALQGTLVQMIVHGLSSAALFILCGQLYERLQTRDMREMGGLWSRLRWFPAFTLFFAAASLGLPGTGNFVGEFLILAGSFPVVPAAVIVATASLVLASAYSLIMVHRTMFGPAHSATPLALPSLRELVMLFSLTAAIIAIGLYPQPLLNLSQQPTAFVQQYYSPHVPQPDVSVP